MPRLCIAELQANQFIEGVYLVQNCQLGQTKGGKPYLKCLLADRTGRSPGRMWNASEDLFSTLPTDGFVWIAGQTQPYQGEMQIIIQQIKAVEPSGDDLLELMPCSEHDPEQMFGELCDILGTIKNKPLAALVKVYLDDPELVKRLKRAPAAANLHHAYLGGLLEHTLSLLRLGQVICPLYPKVNQELVLTGLFLHDLGKCAELSWDRGFSYTTDGQLVGHIARGVIWLDRNADVCASNGTIVPEAILAVLHHIILSHHGKPEFGALKIPATPEALAVSLIDNLDAKMHMGLAATRDESVVQRAAELGGDFTEKIWALETRMYRPDPTTLDQPSA